MDRFPIPVKLKDADDLSEMIDDIKSKTHFSYKPGSSLYFFHFLFHK